MWLWKYFLSTKFNHHCFKFLLQPPKNTCCWWFPSLNFHAFTFRILKYKIRALGVSHTARDSLFYRCKLSTFTFVAFPFPTLKNREKNFTMTVRLLRFLWCGEKNFHLTKKCGASLYTLNHPKSAQNPHHITSKIFTHMP